jgi:hypothetical protein
MGVRCQAFGVTGSDFDRKTRTEVVFETVASGSNPRAVSITIGDACGDGRGQPDDRSDVVGAGSPAELLPSSVNHGLEFDAIPNEEESDALRATDLVRRHRDEIRTNIVYLDGQ